MFWHVTSNFKDTSQCHRSAAEAQRPCVSQLNTSRRTGWRAEVLTHAQAGPEMSSASCRAWRPAKECCSLHHPCLLVPWAAAVASLPGGREPCVSCDTRPGWLLCTREACASGRIFLSLSRECLDIAVEPIAVMGWVSSLSTARSCGHLGTSDSEVTSYSLWAGSCLKPVFINSSFGSKPYLFVYRIVMRALCFNNKVKTAWPPTPSVSIKKIICPLVQLKITGKVGTQRLFKGVW